MAGEGASATTYWPLFDLVVRTPRLELRLLREDNVPAMVDLIDAGIHDPGADALLGALDRRRAAPAGPGRRAVDVAASGQLVG